MQELDFEDAVIINDDLNPPTTEMTEAEFAEFRNPDFINAIAGPEAAIRVLNALLPKAGPQDRKFYMDKIVEFSRLRGY
jgi:hypothetical protein